MMNFLPIFVIDCTFSLSYGNPLGLPLTKFLHYEVFKVHKGF